MFFWRFSSFQLDNLHTKRTSEGTLVGKYQRTILQARDARVHWKCNLSQILGPFTRLQESKSQTPCGETNNRTKAAVQFGAKTTQINEGLLKHMDLLIGRRPADVAAGTALAPIA